MPTQFNFSAQRQYVSVVLAALYELGGENTKMQTIGCIEKKSWLNLEPKDWTPYPKHPYEARWHTNVAFARQWCVDKELVFRADERDSWQITQLGIERLSGVRGKFTQGIYDVRRGYLWSVIFKKWLCPTYEPSAKDAKRAGYILEEFC